MIKKELYYRKQKDLEGKIMNLQNLLINKYPHVKFVIKMLNCLKN